jgi:hypothetical protein
LSAIVGRKIIFDRYLAIHPRWRAFDPAYLENPPMTELRSLLENETRVLWLVVQEFTAKDATQKQRRQAREELESMALRTTQPAIRARCRDLLAGADNSDTAANSENRRVVPLKPLA